MRYSLNLTDGGCRKNHWHTGLLDGHPLGKAAAITLEHIPDFDLGAGIAAIMEAGAFARFQLKEPS